MDSGEVEILREVPTAFISYSWDDEGHRRWVVELGTRLRGDGIDLILDEWHLHPGDQAAAFMERAIRDSDFVIMICTPGYKRRADRRQGGVGYEGNIITAEMLNGGNDRRFIPVLRQGEWADAAASWLLGKIFIDLRGEPYQESSYQVLVKSIFGNLQQPPPIGTGRSRERLREASTAQLEHERVYSDMINSAMRVAQATKNRRYLLKQGGQASRILLENEVEPELKEQAQRFMELTQRARLFSSDIVSQPLQKITEHVMVWQLSVWHPDGDALYDQHFDEFTKGSMPRFREAVRKELGLEG
jgi:hypothetical protein